MNLAFHALNNVETEQLIPCSHNNTVAMGYCGVNPIHPVQEDFSHDGFLG